MTQPTDKAAQIAAELSEGRSIAWFSSGAASAVMTKIAINDNPDALIVQCDMRSSEDADNARFSRDCERWFGKPITYIGSEKYKSVDDVFEARKYHGNKNGAPCTGELKFVPRLNFQLPSDTHLWGYTFDQDDRDRFDRMRDTYPDMKQRAPLIERNITKEDCMGVLGKAGIAPPRVYALGFKNANCIGCVKATMPSYWALIRKEFPEVFARRAEQSRRFGSRLTRLPGHGSERFTLDELPDNIEPKPVDPPRCDFLCQIAADEINDHSEKNNHDH